MPRFAADGPPPLCRSKSWTIGRITYPNDLQIFTGTAFLGGTHHELNGPTSSHADALELERRSKHSSIGSTSACTGVSDESFGRYVQRRDHVVSDPRMMRSGTMTAMTATTAMTTVASLRGSTAVIRVLLIDDDTELVSLLSEYLVQDGFSIATASDGGQGAAEALSGRYALVVLD